MLTFGAPLLALVGLLPLLVMRFAPPYRESRESVRSPFFAELAAQLGETPTPGAVVRRRRLVQKVLLALAWLFLILALVRPQWVGEPIEEIESGRDLMILVDLSTSMLVEDFQDTDGQRISRLAAVKTVLDDFVERRASDRLGMVVFGNSAFIQVPFTLDHVVFRELLDELQPGMAGPQTMLGDALGLAVKAFDVSEAEQKTVILLTDGNDTGSTVVPAKAAELAAQRGLTVHVIGVGDPSSAGEQPLDVATLQQIADTTGGSFFRADDLASLDGVYNEIEALEPLEFEVHSYRPTSELYTWPLAVFLLLVFGYHGWMAVSSVLSSAVVGRHERAAEGVEP